MIRIQHSKILIDRKKTTSLNIFLVTHINSEMFQSSLTAAETLKYVNNDSSRFHNFSGGPTCKNSSVVLKLCFLQSTISHNWNVTSSIFSINVWNENSTHKILKLPHFKSNFWLHRIVKCMLLNLYFRNCLKLNFSYHAWEINEWLYVIFYSYT